MKRFGFGKLVAGILMALATRDSVAADYYCSPNGSGSSYSKDAPGADPNWCSRNLAIKSGDVIHLAKGTYVLSDKQILLQSGVTLLGATDDPADTVIDGNGKLRAACCFQDSMIRNLTMRNCVTAAKDKKCSGGLGFGGAVCAQSLGSREYVVSNCVIENCSATYSGGAGYLGVWRDCVIRNCTVTSHDLETEEDAWGLRYGGCGGGVWGGDLYDCVVTNNSSGLCGGGVAGGTIKTGGTEYYCRATGCLIGWNVSGAGGGAAAANTSSLKPSDTELAQCCQLFRCKLIGNATHSVAGYSVDNGGGADRCLLTQCRIEGNSSGLKGGGAYRSQLTDCVVCLNKTIDATVDKEYGGGGASVCVLSNCTVVCNSSPVAGGGLIMCSEVYRTLVASNHLSSASASSRETTGGAGAYGSVLTECVIENNDSGVIRFGGAMNGCAVTDSIVRNNRASYGGGGYDCDFVRCMITNNLAWERSGGGVYRGTTKNCIIAFNYTTNNVVPAGNKLTGRGAICCGYHEGDLVYSNYYAKGAAVSCGIDDSDVTIVNCTVYGNRSLYDKNHNGFNLGSATNCIICGHSNTDVYNCKTLVNCFWQEDMVTHGGSDSTLDRAVDCIHGKNLDPKFVRQPGEGQCQFSLRHSSPCVDTGANQPWMVTAEDILGHDRIYGEVVDMGACEGCNWMGAAIIVR